MRQTDARQAFQAPSRVRFTPEQRAVELDRICAGFVSRGVSNPAIYRALLERLLPVGSGVPGPVVTQAEMRAAVGAIKPGYQDVFRRVRELQGEEGLTGIIKSGSSYQLVSLAVGAKRIPRQTISTRTAQAIAQAQGWRCAVCGTPIVAEGAGRFDPDHKVPRTRGGGNELANLQGLCPACNNTKSTQCSNCGLPCNTCGWAYPETYRPPLIRPDIITRLNGLARSNNRDANEIANEILAAGLAAVEANRD